ncbi:MAG TPA: alpha/beta hydrolase [Candidatus Moranbacteria bacterium]|nr:alpha/beta hydrolase [Candidatus Moranbacteria bacterium]
MTNKILLLPGWMTGLKLYGKYDNLSMQFGKIDTDAEDVCIIGLSLGALVALRDWNGKGKLILVNPPLPKRNVLIWLIRWSKFILSEGLFLERQKFTKNPFKYIIEIVRCVKLLLVDFSKRLDEIPKENLTMFRGRNDDFFCDDEAVQFMRSKGFQVIEIENCGHNWSENIEKALNL